MSLVSTVTSKALDAVKFGVSLVTNGVLHCVVLPTVEATVTVAFHVRIGVA
jgi:hypothetical protein